MIHQRPISEKIVAEVVLFMCFAIAGMNAALLSFFVSQCFPELVIHSCDVLLEK